MIQKTGGGAVIKRPKTLNKGDRWRPEKKWKDRPAGSEEGVARRSEEILKKKREKETMNKKMRKRVLLTEVRRQARLSTSP